MITLRGIKKYFINKNQMLDWKKSNYIKNFLEITNVFPKVLKDTQNG